MLISKIKLISSSLKVETLDVNAFWDKVADIQHFCFIKLDCVAGIIFVCVYV